jgi:PAS domain S-box-containing protein
VPDRFAEALEGIAPDRLYRALVEANVVGITITDESRLLAANDAFLELVGRTREHVDAGLTREDLTAPESEQVDASALEALRTAGMAGPYEKVYLRPDGTRVPVLLSGMRIRDEPLLVMNTVYDLSERQAVEREIAALYERERDARFAAELAGARIGRLQEITAGLSASRSPDEIARVTVHHAVEDLSGSAGVLVRLEGAELVVQHAIGYQRVKLDQWRRFPLAFPSPLCDAVRERRTVMVNTAAEWESRYPAVGGGDEFAAIITIPLFIGDRDLGALALSFREPRDFSAEDLEFLTSLGIQASAALERAALFENRAYVARKLQEGLLPERLATIPGLETAVRYRSISGGGEVGGDFYDVFEAGEDRWAVAVGDVCGKGTEAAVVTGLARHTVRSVAQLLDGPGEVLAFLNDALRGHGATAAFCTVACGVLRPAASGGFAVTLASGGHPYPVAIRAGGELDEILVSGTMLGVADDPELEESEVTLAPGDALVLYTDGVIDARQPGGERFGEERLMAVLETCRGASAEGIAAAIDDAVTAHDPQAPADDRAVVVLRAAA